MAEYIEKDKAKELFCEFCTWVGTSKCEECEHPVDDVPSADVAPVRHGRWTRIDYEPIGHDYICSVCGWRNDMASHYCPNCGALMNMEEE